MELIWFWGGGVQTASRWRGVEKTNIVWHQTIESKTILNVLKGLDRIAEIEYSILVHDARPIFSIRAYGICSQNLHIKLYIILILTLNSIPVV